MRNRMGMIALIVMTAAGFGSGLLVENKMRRVHAQSNPLPHSRPSRRERAARTSPAPTMWSPTGRKPLSQLPGHDNWTWGAVEGIFAESPNRVFIAQRGELPAAEAAAANARSAIRAEPFVPDRAKCPFRNASQGPVASLPGGGAPGDQPEDADKLWKGKKGVDARWEHNLVVVDASGNIIEDWTQWDNFFERPHAVYINPYDPEKNVWVVDDYKEAIFKFSHDGKQAAANHRHARQIRRGRHTFQPPHVSHWLPDSTMFVADGYNGTRVAKFDKNGKFLLAWGEKGKPPTETRPGYFNVVHGIAADPVTHHVYVVRSRQSPHPGVRRKRQIPRPVAAGQILVRQFPVHLRRSPPVGRRRPQFQDRRYDLDGHLLYAWGTLADYPGGLFNTHGMSVDQEGNFYVAEVGNGRAKNSARARARTQRCW